MGLFFGAVDGVDMLRSVSTNVTSLMETKHKALMEQQALESKHKALMEQKALESKHKALMEQKALERKHKALMEQKALESTQKALMQLKALIEQKALIESKPKALIKNAVPFPDNMSWEALANWMHRQNGGQGFVAR